MISHSKSYTKAIGLRSVIRMYESLLKNGKIKIKGSSHNRLNQLKLKGYKATND